MKKVFIANNVAPKNTKNNNKIRDNPMLMFDSHLIPFLIPVKADIQEIVIIRTNPKT